MGSTAEHRPAGTAVPLTGDAIGATLARHAGRVPDRVAVAELTPGGGPLRTLTYRELHGAAAAAARRLLVRARPGDRVAVWAPNRVEWLVLEYAGALAGLVLVPLNPALTEHEALDLVRRSRCGTIFAVPDFRGRDLLAAARRIAGQLAEPPAVLDLADVLDAPAAGPEPPAVRPDEPFLVQYTSGTTGVPKGAVLSQHVALNIGVVCASLLELGDGPVWVNPMPMHHVGGTVCVAMTVLAAAGTVVLFPAFEPATMLELIQRSRATVTGAVPTMVSAMLDHPDLPCFDLSSLRVLQIGGSTVAPDLIRRAEAAFGARIVNAYGQSEAPAVAQTRLDDTAEVKGRTIGRGAPHRETRIVRPGTETPAGRGEAGELLVRSPLTMSGYLDDPEQTGAVMTGDGWLRTGDLCSMDGDGVISFHGRLREVIVRGGENIYPAEVEAVLLRHPAVADVAVVGAPDRRWGEQVTAFVRFRPGAVPDWSELEAHARQRLAGFKVPKRWRAVDEFPLTASGKIQKFRLLEA